MHMNREIFVPGAHANILALPRQAAAKVIIQSDTPTLPLYMTPHAQVQGLPPGVKVSLTLVGTPSAEDFMACWTYHTEAALSIPGSPPQPSIPALPALCLQPPTQPSLDAPPCQQALQGCWTCGERGHRKRVCPYMPPVQARKDGPAQAPCNGAGGQHAGLANGHCVDNAVQRPGTPLI